MKTTDVAVVGGGLGGLAVATLLARGGRRVVLFEKARHLGGRAHTTHQEGYHLNLGPHALYMAGAAARVLGRLGLELRGRGPRGEGGFALRGGRLHTLPSGLVSLLTTDLLSTMGKLEFARVMANLMRVDASTLKGMSLEEWLCANVSREEVRDPVAMLFRVSTYCADLALLGADAAVAQHQAAMAQGVRYLDGGWVELVRGLSAIADAAGVERVLSARVEEVTREEGGGRPRVHGVRLADGTEWAAEAVVLAAGPQDVAALLPGDAVAAGWAAKAVPVKAATLEVGLSRLPRPGALIAFGVDRPWYASVHSAWARVAPEGGALVHVAKYLGERDAVASEPELEGVLELLQPGWRQHVVTRRFLPGLTVMHALPTKTEGLEGRPRPVVEHLQGLGLVGDWVGPEGMLVDASLSSAEAVARAWLGRAEGARAA
ncbi:amine oxidase flavin-containing [Cystobacter fuscus]|uniref:Amine oxidase flavin-containing n=1 Tax=Cystobacter fuscus TaxID=43 RepID=A0A250JJZ9_9BACT|nr:FAD-dependent oxidoreductase [Cystobacter fuscus]ATB43802.1 amine oxidase flavin-containing [Cystobacter fuscus]